MIQTMIDWQGCNIKGNQLPYAGLYPDLVQREHRAALQFGEKEETPIAQKKANNRARVWSLQQSSVFGQLHKKQHLFPANWRTLGFV